MIVGIRVQLSILSSRLYNNLAAARYCALAETLSLYSSDFQSIAGNPNTRSYGELRRSISRFTMLFSAVSEDYRPVGRSTDHYSELLLGPNQHVIPYLHRLHFQL